MIPVGGGSGGGVGGGGGGGGRGGGGAVVVVRGVVRCRTGIIHSQMRKEYERK